MLLQDKDLSRVSASRVSAPCQLLRVRCSVSAAPPVDRNLPHQTLHSLLDYKPMKLPKLIRGALPSVYAEEPDLRANPVPLARLEH
jgi:hypothetical protein